jgi:hypothetical protein
MSIIIEEVHQILAGDDFDGTVPGTDSDLLNGALVYAPDAAGGLFRLPISRDDDDKELQLPAVSGHSRTVQSVRVSFGGQTSWSLSIIDEKGNSTLWISGTLETSMVITEGDRITLTPGSTLKLSTSGASTAMVAAIAFTVGRKV